MEELVQALIKNFTFHSGAFKVFQTSRNIQIIYKMFVLKAFK